MFEWLKSLFKMPVPAGPPQKIRSFGFKDQPITRGSLVVDQDGWRAESNEKRTFLLFEVPNPGVEQCLLAYRAKLKTEDLQGRVYLEMWCRLPGRGEFFSKGFHHAVKGTNDWATYETPFYLKRGQKPDLVKLNLVLEDRGKVWIKEVELLYTPLK
jgi:hypothetical protein